MISVSEASRRILRHARSWGLERVGISTATGRVLRETVRADRDYPPYDRSKMDGFAVAAGPRGFRVERTLAAGRPGGALRDRKGGCIRIMTGAEIPRGCDSVVPIEDVVVRGRTATLRPGAQVARGQFIHRRGSDRSRGDALLHPGQILRGPQIAIAVSAGRTLVRIERAPRIAVVSTGDEIVAPGRPIKAFEVRASNAFGIQALLGAWGFHDVALFHARDERGAVRRVLQRALTACDVLITTGGVSEGDVDFVPSVLAELGARKIFHKVSQRPGKPLWFGVGRNHRLVFGLPGNPVSTLTCLRRYVLPALCRATREEPARLVKSIPAKGPLTLFWPVTVEWTDSGALLATPLPYGGSGDLTALGASDGFVEWPPGMRGRSVSFYRWAS